MIRRRRFDDPEEEDAKFSVVTDIDPSGPELTEDCLNEELPIMTLRNMVMFPSVIMPVTVGRRSTLKLTKAALKGNKPIVIATQKVMEVEDPNLNDLYTTAVVGRVLREFELPGGNTTVILQASTLKVRIDSVTSAKPYLKGKVSALPEDMEMKENNDELDALLDTAKDLCSKYIEVSENGAQEMIFALKNLPQNHMMINYVCTNFPLPIEDKINMLAKSTLKDRLYTLIQVLNKQTKLALIKQDIQLRTREDLDKQQIVSNIVAYAHARSMQILAEGIEDEIQLRKVIDLGVDLLQGYYLSRPAAVPSPIASEALDVIRAASAAHSDAD